VLQAHGNVSYSVKLEGGRIRKCHIDQLRAADVETPSVGKSVGSSVHKSSEVIYSEVEIPTEVQVPLPEPTIAESPSQTEQEDVTVMGTPQVNT